MRKNNILPLVMAAVCALIFTQQAHAQSETESFEVGAHITGTFLREIGTRDAGVGTSTGGVGGRFAYNFNEHFAFDTAVNLFLGNPATSGRIVQGQFGVKAGVRKGKVGVFGKVRPGFMHFRNDPFGARGTGGGLFRDRASSTEPMVDVGGVVEFYTSDAFFLRLDVGDTIINYRQRTIRPTFSGPEVSVGGFTTHNFQGSFGIGYRF
jgi:hypothetical protein